ncbi:uncharacterized protein LOC119588551 [Penaeus monodon]|uniref:uncharacterized protein LOC119588551 n=1 Tax=Penaeus monodon TaxID=6687 RepID=UPI0018A6FBEB|nr:uncharacterized protein LOC119588551 [Penaeus monodon]
MSLKSLKQEWRISQCKLYITSTLISHSPDEESRNQTFTTPFITSTKLPDEVDTTQYHLPSPQFTSSGGTEVEIECVMRLGEQDLRSSITLKVQGRHSSYLSNYFSAAVTTGAKETAWTTGLMFLLFMLRWNG